MHSCPAENTIRHRPSMHQIRGHNDTLRRRKSSLCDVYLPPIHKQFVTTPVANLEIAKTWSNSTKELIAQEWENLRKIKKRGTLAPKYSVLPPINNKSSTLFNDSTVTNKYNNISSNFETTSNHYGESRDNSQLRRVIDPNQIEEEPAENTVKEIPRARRTSKRRKYKNTQDTGHEKPNEDTPSVCTTSKSSTRKPSKKDKQQKNVNEKALQFPQIESETPKNEKNAPKESTKAVVHTLPKMPSPSKSKNDNYNFLLEKYNEEMIEWARLQGRRFAICYEIDPLYQELTSIIKYNLLVQHLEDIWMC